MVCSWAVSICCLEIENVLWFHLIGAYCDGLNWKSCFAGIRTLDDRLLPKKTTQKSLLCPSSHAHTFLQGLPFIWLCKPGMMSCSWWPRIISASDFELRAARSPTRSPCVDLGAVKTAQWWILNRLSGVQMSAKQSCVCLKRAQIFAAPCGFASRPQKLKPLLGRGWSWRFIFHCLQRSGHVCSCVFI